MSSGGRMTLSINIILKDNFTALSAFALFRETFGRYENGQGHYSVTVNSRLTLPRTTG